jgi:3,4-dihydroxybenzoyl-citryl-spermidine/N-citryl-spermidine--spermidine ligase
MQQLLATKKVEQRVIRQLVEAILFEGILTYNEVIREVAHSFYYLYGREQVYRCEGRRTAFDRIRIVEGTIVQIGLDESIAEAKIESLVEELVSTNEDKERLLNELYQTIKLCNWNEINLPQLDSRRNSSCEELESEIIEGHPYHPCFKSRTGFTIEDHAMYGPEAKNAFTLQWIAVKRDKAQVSILEDEKSFWQRELDLSMWERMIEELEIVGEKFEEYTFLPVHPWQWESMKSELMEHIQVRDILPLSVSGDYYRATQSVRTLWNVTNKEKAYIKLPMNMVNTSSLRNLSAHSVCAAPYISNWIKRVIQSDTYLQQEASLVILEEYTGIMFDSKKETLEGQLGVIWRENVRSYMKDEEEAVPFTALMMIERDGHPFIEEWLKLYGVESWLKRFIEVSVIPVWHLLVAHGIAVEAHAQNMILLHENGWPTRVVLRDFHESVEYQEEFLADASLLPQFEEIHAKFKGASVDDYYWMSSVEALRELMMDTLFVFHLSELSYLLEEQYAYKEGSFWKEVSKALHAHFERFPSLLTRNDELHHTSTKIYVESLLTRKLQNKEGSFRHIVQNELSIN